MRIADPPRKTALILIVDDEPSARQLLSDVMEDIGYLTAIAFDGKHAIEKFQEAQPAVVLMDAMLPSMNGFDATRAIKALPGGAETPVIMVTALSDGEAIDEAFRAGASDYITKPIHPGILINRVQTYVQAQLTEAALQSTRELLGSALSGAPFQNRLLNNLPGMAYRSRHQPQWVMEFVSVGCLALTGYYPTELIDNRKVSYPDLIHPDDRERVWQTVYQAAENGRQFQVTYRLRGADGQENGSGNRGSRWIASRNPRASLRASSPIFRRSSWRRMQCCRSATCCAR
ncbi:MAG: response regulator [Anaerolineae bacterium]|nr:response regulator [Anaerolineae bacterium]